MAGKTDIKKFRSKKFRIALEGATTDGRTIERSWIEDMAAGYDRNLYGARVNCEHIKSVMPESMFGSYGDVLTLSAEEVELGGKTKLGLYAEIQPTDAGIELNKRGQKIYSSIEINPKFADTGKPYLVGLAMTDNPASLGTEALQFSAQHGTLTGRKQHPDNLFSVAEAVEALEFEEVEPEESKAAGLFSRVSTLLGKFKEKDGKDATLFNELGTAVEAVAEHVAEQGQAFATERKARETLQAAHDKLAGEFSELKQALEGTEKSQKPQFSQQRPKATGGDGAVLTAF